MSREAFEQWVSQFDTESNEYLDKGADEFFIAGYKAASNDELRKAAEELVLYMDDPNRIHRVSEYMPLVRNLRAALEKK